MRDGIKSEVDQLKREQKQSGKILNVKMVQRYMDLDGMAYITGMQKEWLILLPVIPNSLETPYPCSKPNQ